MGLSRLILLILLGALLYRLWKRWRLQQMNRRKPAIHDQGHMLACAHCGMYFPEQDAVRDGTQVYCCPAHRDAQRKT
jgi:uncharacterized protein